MNRIFSLLLFLLIVSIPLSAKSQEKLKPIKLFEEQSNLQLKAQIAPNLSVKTILAFDHKTFQNLKSAAPTNCLLEIPVNGNLVRLNLTKTQPVADGFSVINSATGLPEMGLDMGVHYRGFIESEAGSSVAVSLGAEGLSGILLRQDGNYNIGKIENDERYIIYRDKDFEGIEFGECHTKDVAVNSAVSTKVTNTYKAEEKCLKVYVETDFDIFQNKGSMQGVTDYILSLFNQVGLLYRNEGLVVVMSELYVWTSNDPYNGFNSNGNLSAFEKNRKTFNGDVAHLLNMQSSQGGVAYVDVLCGANFRYGFTGIDPSFQDVPTYSWSTSALTHEIGHNIGSPHTHDCSWPGGPIDNCQPPSGFCGSGPSPTNGGTIMSYCHLTSAGTNLANGFGPLPGNLIRQKIEDATCLGLCNTTPVECKAPENVTIAAVTHSSILVNWTKVTGAFSYNLSYKVKGAAQPTEETLTTTATQIKLLQPNTTYQIQVASNCGVGNTSDFSSIQEITTAVAPPDYCVANSTNSSNEWIAKVEIGNIDNESNNNGGYSDFTSKSTPVGAGETINFTLTPGFYRGLLGVITRPEFWSIWVDWNMDGDFTDANESVFIRNTSSTEIVTGNFKVPANVVSGNTRMRIAMKRGSNAASCGSYANGEIEDYSLFIKQTTGIKNENETLAQQITLAPNPAHQLVLVSLSNAPSASAKIILTDLTGKIVLETSCKQHQEIDISKLLAGIYLLQLRDESGTVITKRLLID